MMDQDELFPGNRIEREVRVINASDDRYRTFVSAYVDNGGNATKAAIAAGYSEATAYSQGSRLLKRPEIAEMIAEKVERHLADLDYSARRTLEENARIAYADPRRLFNEQGRMLKFSELDENTARAVASFEMKDGRLHKVKFHDKGSAIDRFFRHHALYRDKLEIGGKLTLEALVTGELAE
jgi:phage terminase small subunit